MDPIWLATASFPVLLILIFLRVPIGLSMLVVGLFGSWQVYGSAAPLLNQMKNLAYGQFSSHSLSIVPLFLLMGQFATLGGMSQALFKAAEAFLGHRKGGAGHGRHRRLRRLRCDLRLVAGHRGHDGPGGAARTQARRVRGQPGQPARWPRAARWAS